MTTLTELYHQRGHAFARHLIAQHGFKDVYICDQRYFRVGIHGDQRWYWDYRGLEPIMDLSHFDWIITIDLLTLALTPTVGHSPIWEASLAELVARWDPCRGL
jgi:hypothetical protein